MCVDVENCIFLHLYLFGNDIIFIFPATSGIIIHLLGEDYLHFSADSKSRGKLHPIIGNKGPGGSRGIAVLFLLPWC